MLTGAQSPAVPAAWLDRGGEPVRRHCQRRALRETCCAKSIPQEIQPRSGSSVKTVLNKHRRGAALWLWVQSSTSCTTEAVCPLSRSTAHHTPHPRQVPRQLPTQKSSVTIGGFPSGNQTSAPPHSPRHHTPSPDVELA